MKKITLLISESNHPVYPFLERWKKEKENIYDKILNYIKKSFRINIFEILD